MERSSSSPHFIGGYMTEKYISFRKAGDMVLVQKLNDNKYVIIARVVEA